MTRPDFFAKSAKNSRPSALLALRTMLYRHVKRHPIGCGPWYGFMSRMERAEAAGEKVNSRTRARYARGKPAAGALVALRDAAFRRVKVPRVIACISVMWVRHNGHHEAWLAYRTATRRRYGR